MHYEIIDDFLSKPEFEAIKEFMMSARMPWHYNEFITHQDIEKPRNDRFQFVHMMYFHDREAGIGTELIMPILVKLKVFTLLRAKVNLTPIMPKNTQSGNHFDDLAFSENGLPYTVGIFYINSNNGNTILDDEQGTEIASVENRLVLLAGNIQHRGSASTDTRRVVLNMNFINADTKKYYTDGI